MYVSHARSVHEGSGPLRYYEQGGFSTLALESMDIDMGEVLSRVIQKRRLQSQGTVHVTTPQYTCTYVICSAYHNCQNTCTCICRQHRVCHRIAVVLLG